MTRFLLRVCFLAAILAGLATTGRADGLDPAQCSADLRQVRADLAELSRQLSERGYSEDWVIALVRFRDSFRVVAAKPGMAERIEGLVSGTVGSVAASLMLGGPPGAGAAVLGAILGSAWPETKAAFAVFGNWRMADQNTAFYQFVLDMVEYGQTRPVNDPNLQGFLGEHAAALERITGERPPLGPDLQQSLYLQAHAPVLLMFFGRFEEIAGAAAFPRWRFPQTQGRHGPDRLAVGYYRPLVAEHLLEELRNLDAEIARLEALACKGEAAAASVAGCAAVPAPGASVTCACSLSQPGTIWGTDLYSADSDLCSAAAHAGAIGVGELADGSYGWQGVVEVAGQEGCPYFDASPRHGVTSLGYGPWEKTFYFPARQRGLCDDASPPARGLWYCPATWGNGEGSLSCHCTPTAIGRGTIWGTGVYTSDSSVCRAARHAGAVGPRGGTVRVLRLGGLDSYKGSSAHGIDSASYGAWGASFGFPDAGP